MQEKIVDFLKRKQGYVSGEQLGSHLGVSRQALWKHINELKDSGYEIVAVPHLGYKLVSLPDRLFASEISFGLNTRYIGRRIYYYETVSSTMDIAMELGIKGASEGTIVVAEAQTEGRGRLGRRWLSPKYKGIYTSIILRPNILPNSASFFSLLSAISVCGAVEEMLGLEVEIKWPNDLLIGNRKFAGILTELSGEIDEVRFIVIGAGINVNSSRDSLPPGATSLKEENGSFVNRADLLKEILRKVEQYYIIFNSKGSAPIIEEWQSHRNTIGKRIKVTCKNCHLEGMAVDIDTDGALLVRTDSGIVKKVMAGDVLYCR